MAHDLRYCQCILCVKTAREVLKYARLKRRAYSLNHAIKYGG